ncbi:putative flavin-binding monooxygenase [Talaromyces proteolyticus]|uniref:Flavin-binding monooxygenase n=1 Tax=Talaromyces proteolyticus TaxID=1131652 RepID=A0AAD4Q0L9_9EURO|nr:putative flavin-binding monooxygenase [Talaromyces proteolyticus]KAH8697396.1 putative flavin-binding monooxygenase [Talaromyces proteolyticus]
MATTLTEAEKKANHIISLPRPPRVSSLKSIDPKCAAQEWLTNLEKALSTPSILKDQIDNLFHSDSYWRDHLALQWDFRTIHTAASIASFLNQFQPATQISKLSLQSEGKYAPHISTPENGVPEIDFLASMFHFETKVGRGTGILRLMLDDEGKQWKAYAVYTSLQELKGAEEPLGPKRVYGTLDSMPNGSAGGTWKERREKIINLEGGQEPAVVVVGAGQSGLNLGARLQSLGVSTLIVDRHERIGDNWRKRYRTLVTHDPAEFTHLAYLPFPKNWPQFTPKDKLGDWFEAYASIMELNVWTSTSVKSASFDDNTSTWVVVVSKPDGFERTIRPRHIVFATGHSGEPKIPSFPGQDTFKGTVYHGSQHRDAAEYDVRGKKVVVVGTGNSGHDIAENFHENGAEVTMLQRRGTYVLSLDKGVFMLHDGTHDEWGPPTEQADIWAESLPYQVGFAFNVYLTQRISAEDKTLLDGLEKAGFEVYKGIDDSGIARLYYTRGGGYYIDVGCSKFIADGSIKVQKSPDGIQEFKSNSLVLADGKELEADFVVLATGYDNMQTTVRKVLGDKVADRCKDVWDLDEEGELRAIWRPSGHPNFWYMGGNLALCRIYSKFLALQIKATEEGLVPKAKVNGLPNGSS